RRADGEQRAEANDNNCERTGYPEPDTNRPIVAYLPVGTGIALQLRGGVQIPKRRNDQEKHEEQMLQERRAQQSDLQRLVDRTALGMSAITSVRTSHRTSAGRDKKITPTAGAR